MFGKKKVVLLLMTIGIVSVFLLAVIPYELQKEVLIKFNKDVNSEQISSFANELGLVKVKTFEEIDVQVFKISSDYSVEEVIKLCSNASIVKYAEPTAEFRALSIATNPEASSAEPQTTQAQVAEFKPGEVIIKWKSGVAQEVIARTYSNAQLSVLKQYNQIGITLCTIGGGKGVLQTVEECNADGNIEYAEPNYIYKHFVEPNDPQFSQLYGLTITDSPAAWDVQTGSKSVIVGVIDTGVDWDHQDLAGNMWTNPGESGANANNGIDDDNNGFIDDFRGWDFANDDNNPNDDNDHGSHVSGTIGAVGNNNIGVVGVNWEVSIMPLKFLSSSGSGTLDDAIECIIYGVNNGAKILSNSWGGGGRAQSLEDAIQFANDNDVLFVAAAGNDSNDNDSFPSYPANYEVPNVISVAASTSSDNLASFSNRGRNTVHLAAPGQDIRSTTKGNTYNTFSGTSMATPHVSGAAALIWAQFPGLSMPQIKIRLLGGVDRVSSFNNTTSTGGRLNVNNSLSTNPIIANTTRLQNTLDETGPYVVNADIIDDGSIQSASLTYQVSGQQAVAVNMTSTGGDQYSGNIPGQVLGSTITYFVSADDNSGNQTRNSNNTFAIAEPPPTDPACGCGRPAIDFNIENKTLKTTANAAANLSFFLLPLAAIGFYSKRKKK